MTIKTRLTSNAPKIAEFFRDKVGAEVSPDTTRTLWLAVLEDRTLLGFLSSTAITPLESRVQVFLPPERWKDKSLVAHIREACAGFFVGTTVKLTMSFPTTWQDSLSLAARLGFQREGLNKKSFVTINGGVIDQLYLGRSRDESAVDSDGPSPVEDSLARSAPGHAEGSRLPRRDDVPA